MTKDQEIAVLKRVKVLIKEQPLTFQFICPMISTALREIGIYEVSQHDALVAEVVEFIDGDFTLGCHFNHNVSDEMTLIYRLAILDTMIAKRRMK